MMITNKPIINSKKDIDYFEINSAGFIDIETIPNHIDANLDVDATYLFGVLFIENGKIEEEYFFIDDIYSDDARREFFYKVFNFFAKYPDCPLFHWHNYEKTTLNKEFDALGLTHLKKVIKKRFIDLEKIIINNVFLPLSSYSIKEVGKYYGYKWSSEVTGDSDSISAYFDFLEHSLEEIKQDLIQYNKDDVRVMLHIYNSIGKLLTS